MIIRRTSVLVTLGFSAGLGFAATPLITHAFDGAFRSSATRVSSLATATIAEPVGVGALGRVVPESRVRRLSPPATITMNRVDRLLVSEGENVVAGQLLAEFADAAEKRAAVAQADAQVNEANAELVRVVAAGRREDVTALKERVTSLRIQQGITQADADRADALVPSGAGARAVAERADAATSRVRAELREAEARLASLSFPRPEDVTVAEAKVRSAQAASERARASAALSQIFAPIRGTILKVHARPGDLVGPEGLLDLADLDKMEIVADVYETDLSRVHIGARANVALPGTTIRYPAEVREVGWVVKHALQSGTDPIAAVDGRTVEVRLSLGGEGAAAVRQLTNAQVHVAIQP
jgi:HlyD family secretion protein